MGRIQSSVGLITGVPIMDTVDALMSLASRPRDMLIARTRTLQSERAAVTELTALLLAVKYITDNLGKEDIFDKRQVSSSDSTRLSAISIGQPPKGTYQFTPLRMVQTQQWLTSGIQSDEAPLGGGKVTFRFGDHVQRSASLDLFGGGEGVTRGKILITDRSGAEAQIDLSAVLSVDDVIKAINSNTTIDVTAEAHGDGLRLTDNTGQTVSNLKVEEVGGTTAASLGLAGIDVAADVADGEDMLWIYEDIDLRVLNDGNGIHTDHIFADIDYELRDGTTGSIDLSPIVSGSSDVDVELTLGDVLDVINAIDPAKLKAEIAPDGERLIITDLTVGSGEFQLSAAYESGALADLGLDGQAVDGVITGSRLLGGAKTVLLSSLNGGQGFGQLGTIKLIDRNGSQATVDLSGAETFTDIIDAINAAGVGITARVNQARTGLELVDTTGASAGNMVVASNDITVTAEKLGIAVNDDVTSVNTGDLHLQVISQNTLLSELNGGAGVAKNSFEIIDANGRRETLDLVEKSVETVGDLIREINRLGLDISADINATGDGILLRDTSTGGGSFQIVEGRSTTAADLYLLGESTEVEINFESVHVIDGSTTFTVELDDEDSLSDLRQKINDLDAGLNAMTFHDGSSKPFRLSLTSDRAGSAGALVIDTSGVNFSMQETVRAADALLVFGDPADPTTNVLVSSTTNKFRDVVPGVSMEIHNTSTTPVTITVGTTDADLIASVRVMVENYNRFREKLTELTAYNSETETRSILTGDPTALRLDTDLAYLLSGRFAGSGGIRSLATLGIDLKDDGTLDFDEAKLKSKYAEDPEAVKTFFLEEEFGLSAKFGDLLDRLTDEQSSLLTNRTSTLDKKIERNGERVVFMAERLNTQRDRLLKQFYNMEMAIAKLQSGLTALNALYIVPPMQSNGLGRR